MASWIEIITSEDNPYYKIISLAIWVFSFIYFIDFRYFVIFSSEEQICLYLYIFIFIFSHIYIYLFIYIYISIYIYRWVVFYLSYVALNKHNWYCYLFLPELHSISSFAGDCGFHFISLVNRNLVNLRTELEVPHVHPTPLPLPQSITKWDKKLLQIADSKLLQSVTGITKSERVTIITKWDVTRIICHMLWFIFILDYNPV